jgi:Leu/Phe-tRNA-protein transferase
VQELLTAAQKLNRRAIVKHYEKDVKRMYKRTKSVLWWEGGIEAEG